VIGRCFRSIISHFLFVPTRCNFLETATLTRNLSVGAQQDYALVKKAIAGNQWAYSKLMQRHQKSVFLQMLKRTQNRDEANDLTIEAFSKAFRHLQKYVPRFAFQTWLIKIAVNNYIDYNRKRRISYVSLDNSIDENSINSFADLFSSNDYNPEEVFIQQQELERIKCLMKQIAKPYQAILEMRFYEDLSYEEISEKLEMPLGTVKTQIFRGRNALKILIEKNKESIFS